MFQVNPLLGRDSHEKIQPYFLQKIKVKKIKVSSAAILLGTLWVNGDKDIKRLSSTRPSPNEFIRYPRTENAQMKKSFAENAFSKCIHVVPPSCFYTILHVPGWW